MAFLDGHVEEEKMFKGKVFPRTLLPPPPTTLAEPDLVDIIKGEQEWLAKILNEHGAILFRGFSIHTAEDFSHVVKALGFEEFPYQGIADRIKLADQVYTATAVPSDIMISFHHEMSMMKKFPRKIIFFCEQPPPAGGGQTSIIPSSILVEKLEEEMPQVTQKMEADGIIFTLHTKSKSTYENASSYATVWQRMLKTNDQVEAEKRAIDTLDCNKVKFNSDGTANFTFGPMNPIRQFDNNKRVMFPRIVPYETAERYAFITFGDGSSIPTDTIETIEKIYKKNCVDINWKKGDILLVDNLAVQHVRRPGKPPRVVWVSISN